MHVYQIIHQSRKKYTKTAPCAARGQQFSLEKTVSSSFSPIPLTLATADRLPVKTDNAKLLWQFQINEGYKIWSTLLKGMQSSKMCWMLLVHLSNLQKKFNHRYIQWALKLFEFLHMVRERQVLISKGPMQRCLETGNLFWAMGQTKNPWPSHRCVSGSRTSKLLDRHIYRCCT